MWSMMLLVILSTAGFDPARLYRKPDADKIDARCYQIIGDQIIVWVYFTDKGIFEQTSYNWALLINEQAMSRPSESRRHRRGGVYDFDDLPVVENYIDEIVATGATLRWESAWLNAASFIIDKKILEKIAGLKFVYKVVPVSFYSSFKGFEPYGEEQISDTSALTYKQNQMFKIDRLHHKTIFGSNIKIGFLDTGFRKKHEVFDYIKLVSQYDFISGDRIVMDTLPFYQRVNIPMRKGLIGDMIVHDGNKRDFIIYSNDSLYTPRDWSREIYVLESTDGGHSWSGSVDLSKSYNRWTSASPWACGRETVYVFWHETDGFVYSIYCKARVDTGWQVVGNVISQGLFPSAEVIGDTLFLTYVYNDSVLAVRKGTIDSLLNQFNIYRPGERIRRPWIVTRGRSPNDSLIGIFLYTASSQNIVFMRSTDRGQNFNFSRIIQNSTDFAVASQYDTIYIIFKAYRNLPTPYLAFMKSTDFGLTWTGETSVSTVLPTIGSIGLDVKGKNLFTEWERGGTVYHRRSDDGGGSWGRIDSLRGDFFYLPTPRYLTFQTETTLFNFWLWRGDNNTDYESEDKNRYQPDHGSHMMSVVGGFKSGTFVGVAPSAEFYMAKTENADSLYEFPIEEDAYIVGLEWLEEKGVDVVNSSLGYSNWYGMQHMDGKTAPISIAAALASKRGMLIVTAAGNRGADTISVNPYLTAPGDADGVITVGGIDTLYGRWRGSGYGPTADGRRKPDLVGLSKNATIAYGDSSDYRYSLGTSNAAALVTGICALLLEGHPNWTADSVKYALFKTAKFANNPNDTMGYGWPDAEKAFNISPTRLDTTEALLLPPFPNPFMPGSGSDTLIYLPFKINNPASVEIKIYSMSGRLVYENSRTRLLPGFYNSKDPRSSSTSFSWNGKDMNGRVLGSGIYYVLLLAHPGKDVKKLAIIR